MRLELENGTTIDEPTAAQIAQALGSLNAQKDNSFAILQRADQTYVQTAQLDDPDQAEPHFALEYQEGSTAKHFEAVAEDGIPLPRIIAAFQKYAAGDDSWRGDFEWTKMDL